MPDSITVPVDVLSRALNVLASLPYNHAVPGSPSVCSGDVVTELRALMAGAANQAD